MTSDQDPLDSAWMGVVILFFFFFFGYSTLKSEERHLIVST